MGFNIGACLAFALSSWFLFRSLVTGRVPRSYTTSSWRHQDPLGYWTTTVIYALLAFGSLVALLGSLLIPPPTSNVFVRPDGQQIRTDVPVRGGRYQAPTQKSD